jgi:hypothetical protein
MSMYKYTIPTLTLNTVSLIRSQPSPQTGHSLTAYQLAYLILLYMSISKARVQLQASISLVKHKLNYDC